MLKKAFAIVPLFCGLMAPPTASAGVIPYPSVGTVNPATYTFTAAATGNIIAYFAGSGAGYTQEIGMFRNGVVTGVQGLNNQTSVLGQSLNLGAVAAGDTLRFYDRIFSTGDVWDSKSSLNVDLGHHVYSTSALAGQAYSGSPVGTYVAFEDLRFPRSDFNYHDDTFVFTNVAVSGGVPETSTWMMMLLGFAGLGFAGYRRQKTGIATT